MRGFSRWARLAASALERWSQPAEAERARRDRELLGFLRARREDGVAPARERLEALLSRLGPVSPEALSEEAAMGRLFWAPLTRLYPQGECWEWMGQWAKASGSPLELLGARPADLFARGARLDAKGSKSGARLARAALKLGLGMEQKGPFEDPELTPLGEALSRGAWGVAAELRGRGASWEGCGLEPTALALRAKDALWPEPLEALAARGARLLGEEAAPSLDFHAAIERGRKAGLSAGEAEGLALRCAKALLAMGADPNQAPARGLGGALMFPLEGALAARAPRLAEALLEAGADPEDARVKGRLARARGPGENPAMAPLEREIARRKAERDERYALWGMYKRGELFAPDGKRVDLSHKLAAQRARRADASEGAGNKEDSFGAPKG